MTTKGKLIICSKCKDREMVEFQNENNSKDYGLLCCKCKTKIRIKQ